MIFDCSADQFTPNTTLAVRNYVILNRAQCLPALLMLLTLLPIGCRSGSYRASQIPPQLQAPPATGDVSVNLARMSGAGYDNSLISPDDLLEISILSGRNDEERDPIVARVSSDGTLDVPIVGPVPVANLSPFDASHGIALAAVERGVYQRPNVTVEIKKKAVNHVTVLGAVAKPGVHELPRGSSDIVSALAVAGGLSEEAGTEVEIIRQSRNSMATRFAEGRPNSGDQSSNNIELASYSHGGRTPQSFSTGGHNTGGPQVERIDLAQVSRRDVHGDYSVGDRDVVMVLPRKVRTVHVSGLVNKPGQFELSQTEDLRVLDAIALAGGSSSMVADRVFVIRRLDESDKSVVIQASIRKAKHDARENLVLAAGDMVSIEQTPVTAVVDSVSKFLHLTVGISGRTGFF